LKVGVETTDGGRLMVYVAEAVSLSVMRLMNAFAFIVLEEVTEIGLEYVADDDEGSDPSVVYIIVAPGVGQLRTML